VPFPWMSGARLFLFFFFLTRTHNLDGTFEFGDPWIPARGQVLYENLPRPRESSAESDHAKWIRNRASRAFRVNHCLSNQDSEYVRHKKVQMLPKLCSTRFCAFEDVRTYEIWLLFGSTQCPQCHPPKDLVRMLDVLNVRIFACTCSIGLTFYSHSLYNFLADSIGYSGQGMLSLLYFKV
jgi:hypothetical protein